MKLGSRDASDSEASFFSMHPELLEDCFKHLIAVKLSVVSEFVYLVERVKA
jgi:hypothetical protein